MLPFSKFLKSRFKPKAGQLYGAAMAQARKPVFYTSIGADDTPDGRLALISLHILLVLQRLSGPIDVQNSDSNRSGPGTGSRTDSIAGHSPTTSTEDFDPALGRALMEVFVEDLDQAMRELGIGDMGVPRRVKKAMAQFYDYAHRFRMLREDDTTDQLHTLLCDMIPGLSPNSAGVTVLSRYVRNVENKLAIQATQRLAIGDITFPDLDGIYSETPSQQGSETVT